MWPASWTWTAPSVRRPVAPKWGRLKLTSRPDGFGQRAARDVERILEATDGYVISTNKNSPKMTVIAGETAPVKAAIAAFEAESMPCTILQTSHAFHSKIVAPANAPLRAFLEELDSSGPPSPSRPTLTGPSTRWKETRRGRVENRTADGVLGRMDRTIETMAAAGAGAFVEVGPKRADRVRDTDSRRNRTLP